MSKRSISLGFQIFIIFALAGCSSDSKLATNSDLSGGLWSISVSSPAFNNMGMIPVKYTQDGENVSPPLAWSKGPGGTKEFVLVIEDPDAPGDFPYLHWFVYRIPVTRNQLAEGASSDASLMQGKNYLGKVGYAAPKPPPGKTHRYFFEVFALDTPQDWPEGMERSMVRARFKGHVLAKGQLIGQYKAAR